MRSSETADTATSRFRKRLAARRNHDDGQSGPVLTPEDDATLREFGEDLDAVTTLLHDEIDAITAGALEEVTRLYEPKAVLLKRIELRMPVVEAFLTNPAAHPHRLRERLVELQDAVAEDSALLARMADATGAIVREIEKIRDRQSLSGTYGKNGRRLQDDARAQRQIDKTL